MNGPKTPSGLKLTMAARSAIAAAIARHSHPVAVRVAVLPGIPPMARMSLETPRPDDEVLGFGDARLLVDPSSRWYLEGATVDYSSDLPRGHFTISGPRLDGTPSGPAALDPGGIPSGSDPSQPPSRSPQ